MTHSHPRSPDPRPSLPPNLQFVLGLSPSAMTLGLGNITTLLSRIDNPQRRMRTAVIAGTNGKGSVTAMLAALLHGEGVTTGRFTSPHVYSVTERVSIDGQDVALEEMETAAARIAPLHAEIGFSYFEAITAIAFLLFAERGVDVAVMETGLGGRFDATNVTTPEVSVITSISVDHRRILGDTEEEILREKLGITRPGTPLLIGEFDDRLRRCIDEKCARDRVPVESYRDVGSAERSADGERVRFVTRRADYGDVRMPFPGAHQAINALLALGAAEHLMGGALKRAPEALAHAYLPGRFERFVRGSRTFVVDVAHNEAALIAAASELARMSPRRENAVVLGLLRRKELLAAPAKLMRAASRIYLVSPEAAAPDPAFAPHELLFRHVYPLLTEAPTDAILWNQRAPDDDHWRRLFRVLDREAHPASTILVTGSHHVVEQFGRRLRGERTG